MGRIYPALTGARAARVARSKATIRRLVSHKQGRINVSQASRFTVDTIADSGHPQRGRARLMQKYFMKREAGGEVGRIYIKGVLQKKKKRK